MGEYPPTLTEAVKSLQIKLQAKSIQRKLPSHIKIKLLKINDNYKILKAVRERTNSKYKGTTIRIKADFSSETV